MASLSRAEESRVDSIRGKKRRVVERYLAASYSSYRKRGSRALLAAGIARLRACGASSVTLGVDANDPAPLHLYPSVGFQISTSQEAWDKAR